MLIRKMENKDIAGCAEILCAVWLYGLRACYFHGKRDLRTVQPTIGILWKNEGGGYESGMVTEE